MKTDKLTIEHLAPYLPYGLKMKVDKWIEAIGAVSGFDDVLKETRLTLIIKRDKDRGRAMTWTPLLKDCKPVLRPLSDITKEIEHKGERFVPIDVLKQEMYMDIESHSNIPTSLMTTVSENTSINILCEPLEVIGYLFKWHFDVFNLIEVNLAIDINTLQS